MADHNADHKHGSMNIRDQEKTFAGFIRMSIWVVAISIGILIFMALVNS
jgi:Bacterial aa3 type cytochrome c oxidase subunit IV